MSRNRFVAPETVRLDLSDGDWIEIKARLGIAEDTRLKSAGVSGVRGSAVTATKPEDVSPEDAEAVVDFSRFYLAKLETYLVDWSFRDGAGKHVRCTPQAIAALDPESAAEITEAINAYLDEQEAKKRADPSTPSGSAARSA